MPCLFEAWHLRSWAAIRERASMNVLIVEDSGPMRRLIKEIVSGLADEVHECGDGADALAASPTRPQGTSFAWTKSFHAWHELTRGSPFPIRRQAKPGGVR